MEQKPNNFLKMLLPWVALMLVMSTAWTLLSPSTASSVTYEELYAILEDKPVTDIVISPSDYVATIEGVYTEKGREVAFTAEIPNNDTQVNQIMDKIEDLNEDGKKISLVIRDISGDGLWATILINVVPLILMVKLIRKYKRRIKK